MKAAEQHFPGTECEHLESVKYAEIPSFCNLQKSYLVKLQDMGLVSQNKMHKCIELHKISENLNVPLAVYGNFGIFRLNSSVMYFSILTQKASYYALMQRVRVTCNKSSGHWSCLCRPMSNMNQTCVH